MKLNRNKTVLFVFSLSAKLEAERKPLFGSRKKNISKAFFKNLNKNTLQLAKESGVDIVWLNETQQEGNTFNDRFTNAFKSLFQQGYTNVISIGNDTPGLSIRHIKKAISTLGQKQMVLGPSKDGGVYLLGYNKSSFDAATFKNFSWLTDSVSIEIQKAAIQQNTSFTILETLVDIDAKNTAIAFAYSNPVALVSIFILEHIFCIKSIYNNNSFAFPPSIAVSTFFLRGPPALAL